MLHVPIECSPTVSANLSKRCHFRPSNEDTVAKVSLKLETQTNNPQEAASSSSVASQRLYDNFHVAENTESQQEGHSATIFGKRRNPGLIPLND